MTCASLSHDYKEAVQRNLRRNKVGIVGKMSPIIVTESHPGRSREASTWRTHHGVNLH